MLLFCFFFFFFNPKCHLHTQATWPFGFRAALIRTLPFFLFTSSRFPNIGLISATCWETISILVFPWKNNDDDGDVNGDNDGDDDDDGHNDDDGGNNDDVIIP